MGRTEKLKSRIQIKSQGSFIRFLYVYLLFTSLIITSTVDDINPALLV